MIFAKFLTTNNPAACWFGNSKSNQAIYQKTKYNQEILTQNTRLTEIFERPQYVPTEGGVYYVYNLYLQIPQNGNFWLF